jgi:hypothetical protein
MGHLTLIVLCHIEGNSGAMEWMFGRKDSRGASNLPKKRWKQIKKGIQDKIGA